MSNPSKPETKFEGCGILGPLRSIFFAEFHPTAGPKIRCQAGQDVITKDLFEAISVYIIPKPQLDRTPLTVNALDRKICGYPVILKNENYKRNQFVFNVCFVCYPWSRTVQYEPALIKLSNFLVDLELECGFLYNEQNEVLQALLQKVYTDINERGECSAEVNKYTLRLKVISNAPDPDTVHDWHVPVLMVQLDSDPIRVHDNKDMQDLNQWDLTTQQILPYVDGINHVAKIAAYAGVDSNLVKAAIQNLLYHRVVEIVPIFMYSNVYCLTPKVSDLRDNVQLRQEFMEFIKKDPPANAGEEQVMPQVPVASFRDVYKMISDFDNHTTVSDICQRYRPRENMNIDENRLVQFLVLKKILRRVHKYPVYVSDANNVAGSLSNINVGGVKGSASEFYPFFNGQKHFDEICCRTGISARKLEEQIDNDPNVYVLRQ